MWREMKHSPYLNEGSQTSSVLSQFWKMGQSHSREVTVRSTMCLILSPPLEPANNVEWKRRLVISIEAGTLPALCNTQEVGIIYCPHLTDDRTKVQGSWASFPNSLS